MNTTLTGAITQQNYSNLLLKLKETETENDLLKKEIKRLKLERQEAQHWDSNLKDLLTNIEHQVDSINSSSNTRFTYDIYNTLVNLIWKSFSYECVSSHVKEVNLRLRDKLNKKLSGYTNESDDTISKTYSFDLNYLMQESTLLKEKVAQQTRLIKSIIESFMKQQYWLNNKLNMNSSTNSFSVLSSITTQQTTTSNEVDDDEYDNYQYDSSETRTKKSSTSSMSSSSSSKQYFICPKCEISIDKRQVTFAKFDQHVNKCEPSKLVCIFCLEIFDLNKEVEFDQHIQRHIRLVDSANSTKKDEFNLQIEYNVTNTSSSSTGMNITRSESGSNSSSTNISSNLASSFSSRSNSNVEISSSTTDNSADSKAPSVPQQVHHHRNINLKSCLLIQNFEPKIRKRL